MPLLKHIECSIELGPKNKRLREYYTRYGDAFVETYVAVPNENENFTIHFKTLCHISSGLSALIFIDGQIQCNKGKVNLKAHDDLTPHDGHGIDWRFTSKDESLDNNGWWIGREWSFQNLNAQDSENNTKLEETQSAQGIGLIEVVVLRCRANTDSATNDAAPGADTPKKITPTKPSQEDKASSVGVAGLFDGANDTFEPTYSPEMEFALDGPYDSPRGRRYHEGKPHRRYHNMRSNAANDSADHPREEEYVNRRREYSNPRDRRFTRGRFGTTEGSFHYNDDNYRDDDPFDDASDGVRRYSSPDKRRSSTRVRFDDYDSDFGERNDARRRPRESDAYSQYMANRELSQRQSARDNYSYQCGIGDAYAQYMANRELGQRHSKGDDRPFRYGSGDAYSQYMANREPRARPIAERGESHQHRADQNTDGFSGRAAHGDIPPIAETGLYHRSRSIYGDMEGYNKPRQHHTDHSRQSFYGIPPVNSIVYAPKDHRNEYNPRKEPRTYEITSPVEASLKERFRRGVSASKEPNTYQTKKGHRRERYWNSSPCSKTTQSSTLTYSSRPSILTGVPIEHPIQTLKSPIQTPNKRSPLRTVGETYWEPTADPRVEAVKFSNQVTGGNNPSRRTHEAASGDRKENRRAVQTSYGQNNVASNNNDHGNDNGNTEGGTKENYTTPNWSNVQSKYDRISNKFSGSAAAGNRDGWDDQAGDTKNDENQYRSWDNQDNSYEYQNNSWENQDASGENQKDSWDKQGEQDNQENSWGGSNDGNKNQKQTNNQNQSDSWANWDEQNKHQNTKVSSNNADNKATGDWDKAPDTQERSQPTKLQQRNTSQPADASAAATTNPPNKAPKRPKSSIGVIKPYWKNFRMGKHLSSSNANAHPGGAYPSRPPPTAWDGRGADPYVASAQPLPPVPRSMAEKHGLSHQVMAGKGAPCYKRRGKPIYVDSVDAPYAVFVFKYRSKEMIEKLLPGVTVKPPREDKREKMMSMSKMEMMRELRRAKKLAGYETDSTLTGDTDDDSEDQSEVALKSESKGRERKKNGAIVADRPKTRQEPEIAKKSN